MAINHSTSLTERPATFALDALLGSPMLVAHGANLACLLRAQRIGEIGLPSGRIVVAAPEHLSRERPLARRVRPGRYVWYVVREETHVGSDCVGFLLRFSDAAPIEWERAAPGGVQTQGATITVADELAARRFVARPHERSVDASVRGMPAANVARMHLGSDGSYPLTWGLDAHGEPACLFFESVAFGRGFTAWGGPAEGPRIALDDLLGTLAMCDRWARSKGETALHRGGLSDAELRGLEEIADRPMPEHLRAYYSRYRPTPDFSIDRWRSVSLRLRALHGWHCYPVRRDVHFAVVARVAEDGTYDVVEVKGYEESYHRALDLLGWFVTEAIDVYELR